VRSSGKSTFINHVLGRKVQTTGVAPTDDGFTVIASGSNDLEQDGPALVSDPDLGFGSLRQFGESLVSHVQLKVRSKMNLRGVFLVDSPGMIDSPMSTEQLASLSPGAHTHLAESLQSRDKTQDGSMSDSALLGALRGYSGAGVNTNASPRDRGYNFPGVVRWFATRADVVLLFFDPDKPGTTGETLAVMRTALAGLEHKVLFVLNKADQFHRVHDFARAYGSLCWNLSKVIPRKDLPPVYTMCVPPGAGEGSDGAPRPTSGAIARLPETASELDSNRQQVLSEVFRAPARRADNLVSRLYDSASLLHMHATVLSAIKREASRKRSAWVLASVGSAVVGAGSAAGLVLLGGGVGMGVAGSLGAAGVLSAAGCWAMASKQTSALQTELLSNKGAGLDQVFRREYFRALAEGDDSVVSMWNRVRPHVAQAIATLGLWQIPSVSHSSLDKLSTIVASDVPSLRRAAGKAAKAIEDDLIEHQEELKKVLA
jgi:hypothetical protein